MSQSSQIKTVARRELRAYFRSPVALIFLGAFLIATLIFFFWVGKFFSRNIADIRPLFEWLPFLLIFLVGALTMRLWSEEHRSGTVEVLLTLPVPTSRLVLGKFFAGLALVVVALLLTLGIPITVSMMGDLDWGPVFGGYVAALLVASTYLALGLCFSAATDNMIVSLLLTWLGCFLLYLPGAQPVVASVGMPWSEILAGIGTGSRFASIQRGVIDLRDLVYYASLTVGFLFLNVVILEARRWSTGPRSEQTRSKTQIATGLVFANVILLNVILAPLGWARADLTERKEHSISPVTKKLLRQLDAPLLIRGYFSQTTHPELSPLVPMIRDKIHDYGAAGGDKVIAEFVNPGKDEAVEKEANETYSIKPVPLLVFGRHEKKVVNAYFHILVKYGDKFETLSFEDLIETKVTGMRQIEVKLKNLEYDLTRTIKKVVWGFQPLETLFARAPGKVKLTAFVSEKNLPEVFKEVPKRLKEVAQEIKKRGGDKFVFEQVDPTGKGKESLRRQIYRKYGFKPMALSLFSEGSFYLYMLVQLGDRFERLVPAEKMTKADLRGEIEAAMKRLAPGFLKTVGLVAPTPKQPPPRHPMMRQPPPQMRYQMLRRELSENYQVRTPDLKDGRVPGNIDTLVVIGGEKLDDKQKFAIDQFLMLGGSVVVAQGNYELDPGGMGMIRVKKSESGVEEMLATYGVTIKPTMVLDPQNEAFPLPVERNLGGFTVREIKLLQYPYWPDVRGDGLAEGNVVVGGLPAVTMQWSSPLEVKEAAKKRATVLLRSSEGSFTLEGTDVQPNFAKHAKTGFPGPEGKTAPQVLAVTLTGPFESYFADKPSPLFKDEGDPTANKGKKKHEGGRTIKKSPKASRLAVVGSANFVNDIVLSLSRQGGSSRFANNLQLMENLVDWSVADVDLLAIRSRSTFARTLAPMTDGKKTTYEVVNYGLVVLALVVIAVLGVVRRRNVQPMQLSAAPRKAEEV
jgi:ABC-2 type transport system permease protein